MTKRGRGAERGGKEGHKMAGGIPDKSCICVCNGEQMLPFYKTFLLQTTKALNQEK